MKKRIFNWFARLFEVQNKIPRKRSIKSLINHYNEIKDYFFYSWEPIEEGKYTQYDKSGKECIRYSETLEGYVENVSNEDFLEVKKEMTKTFETMKKVNDIRDFTQSDKKFLIFNNDGSETVIEFLNVKDHKVSVLIYVETYI